MADEDEHDPVIAEIDVYLAKSLAENLHLFQYPTRPAAVTYDKTQCLAAKVKPKQQKVMLEMALNTCGPSYCTSKGEQIAYRADHNASDDKKCFESNVMDKQVLLSSQGTMSTSQYAVGYLKNAEVHLTPLKGVVQLRPSFQYLDRESENKKANDEGDSQDEEEEKPTALSVRFAKKETEYAKAQRLASYKHLEKQMAEEQWIDVQYFGNKESVSTDERDLLFCQEMNTEVLEFDPSSSNYIENLMPSDLPKDGRNSPVLPETNISITRLKRMDLIDQVKCLLLNAKVLNFTELCSLINTNEQAVLKCVQQHAVLVQGCWVVKSELLYPKGKDSAYSSAMAETLCRARDYVLYQFTQSRSLQRHDIIAVTKLTIDDVNDIIKQVAKRNVTLGWEFKLPFDDSFVERYRDIETQQQAFWASKYKILCDKYKIKPKQVKNIADEVDESCTEMNNHVAELKMMEVDLRNGFTKRVVKTENCYEQLSSDEQDELFQQLVKFVKDKISTGSLSLAEFKKLILLHQTVAPPGDLISTGVSDKLLLRAIEHCGGEEIDLKWPMTSQYPSDLNSRRIFFLREVDSPYDKYRGVVFDLFRGSFGIQRKAIMERTKEVLGSSPTSTEYTHLIQELGLERKGTLWYVRGTLAT